MRPPTRGDGRGRTARRSAAAMPREAIQARRRARARGPAAHRRRAEPQHRARTSCSSRTAAARSSRGPLLRLGAIRDRAVDADRSATTSRRRARRRPRGSSRAATCRRSCSAASSPASRACSSPRRRRAGSTSARSRPSTRTCATRPATGMGVLLISEDLDEILALADRIVVMYEGADRRRARRARRRRRGARPADGRRRALAASGLVPTLRIERRLHQPRWLNVAVPAGSLARRLRPDRRSCCSRRTIRRGIRSRGSSTRPSPAATRSTRR